MGNLRARVLLPKLLFRDSRNPDGCGRGIHVPRKPRATFWLILRDCNPTLARAYWSRNVVKPLLSTARLHLQFGRAVPLPSPSAVRADPLLITARIQSAFCVGSCQSGRTRSKLRELRRNNRNKPWAFATMRLPHPVVGSLRAPQASKPSAETVPASSALRASARL